MSAEWVMQQLKDIFLISFLFDTTMAVKYPISDWTKGFHFAEENKNLLNQNENQKMFTSDWTKSVISPQTRFLSVDISLLFQGFGFLQLIWRQNWKSQVQQGCGEKW